MVTLKTDFIDGNFLTAGVVTSTSSVNGITATINSNTLTKLAHIGSDTEGSIADSTSETTIATVLVPANTVATQIKVEAPIQLAASNENLIGTFKVKIGPTGSEVLKQTIVLNGFTAGTKVGTAHLFIDDSQTWTADVTVLVTAQCSIAGANNIATCYHLVVEGF